MDTVINSFADVPAQDYIDSIRNDIADAEDEIADNPMYLILNLSRVLAFLKDGLVLSKKEGGEWAQENVPDMKYENARDILPASLLEEVQKYAEGKAICSAGRYSDAGIGEEWVRIYLESKGMEMPDDSEFFLSELVKIPLRLIEDDADAVTAAKPEAYTDVPLIIIFEGRRFRIFCGATYLSFLKRVKKMPTVPLFS